MNRRSQNTAVDIYYTCCLLWTGNATYAGGLAALVANLVLAAYVVAAFLEDDSDIVPAQVRTENSSLEAKKGQ